MKLMCIQACVDSAECKSYRIGNIVDFNGKEILRLKEIDQLRRFKPQDEQALKFVSKIPGGIRPPEAIEKEAKLRGVKPEVVAAECVVKAPEEPPKEETPEEPKKTTAKKTTKEA